MATTLIQRRYASAISGSVLCIAGLVIFVYLSPSDFLEPGFVRDGILIQDQYVSPTESLSAILPVKYTGQDVTVSVINPLSDIPLRIEIKDPDGMTIYDSDSYNSLKATFRTEVIGKYTVTVTNIGSEITKITVPYGHHLPEMNNGQDTDVVLGVLWIPLVILGSYLIVHTDFKVLSKERA